MFGKRFLIGLLSPVVVLIAYMIILDVTSPGDTNMLLKGVFQDVFMYARPAAQDEVYEKLVLGCDGVMNSDFGALCSDPKKRREMDDLCTRYAALSPAEKQLIPAAELARAEQACSAYSREELQKACGQREYFASGFCSAFGSMTKDEAFASFIWLSLEAGIGGTDSAEIQRMQKVASIMDMSTAQKVAGGIIMVILLVTIILLLRDDLSAVFRRMGHVFFEIGVLLILPIILVYVYMQFVGVDTTFILNAVVRSGAENIDTSLVMKNVIPLVVRRLYPLASGVVGLVCAVLGIILWVCGLMISRRELQQSH